MKAISSRTNAPIDRASSAYSDRRAASMSGPGPTPRAAASAAPDPKTETANARISSDRPTRSIGCSRLGLRDGGSGAVGVHRRTVELRGTLGDEAVLLAHELRGAGGPGSALHVDQDVAPFAERVGHGAVVR